MLRPAFILDWYFHFILNINDLSGSRLEINWWMIFTPSLQYWVVVWEDRVLTMSFNSFQALCYRKNNLLWNFLPLQVKNVFDVFQTSVLFDVN